MWCYCILIWNCCFPKSKFLKMDINVPGGPKLKAAVALIVGIIIIIIGLTIEIPQ